MITNQLPYSLTTSFRIFNHTDARIEISLQMIVNINQIDSQWYQYQSHLDMNVRTSSKYVIIIRI